LTLTERGGSLAEKQGYAGSFFTGVLAWWCNAMHGSADGSGDWYALAQSAVVKLFGV